jgi:hypothetical protein
MTIDPNLGYGNQGLEVPFPGMVLFENTSPGQPTFSYQRTANGGFPGSSWWQIPNVTGQANAFASSGSNYSTGLYPFTASGGGCAREPAGVWFGGNSSLQITDPGFGCQTSPTFSAATIPNAGAQQTGITATCASGGLGMLVTTSVPVSPGLSPGLTYALSAFTTSPANALNTPTWTATSVTGSGPFTIVGTAAGSCPTISSTGTFGSGSGGAYTFPGISSSNPLGSGGTGITTKNGQHICFMLGEYGDDSGFAGAQFLSMVDDEGNALPGSPALVQIPNMGAADFVGSTTSGSAVLTVSAMNPHTITRAAWSNGVGGLPSSLGVVTFQVSSNPGYIPGSQFTVSGMLPSSANGTYIAMTGTNSTQVVGSQLTGPLGIPQAYANPGSITLGSTPQAVSVIVPGMVVLGSTAAGTIAPSGNIIMPYGTLSAGSPTTGTGGVGTYVLNATQTANVSGIIVAYSAFYYGGAIGGSGPGGSAITVRAPSVSGDVASMFGSTTNTILPQKTGWGGALGDFAMLYGAVPSQIGGAPSTSDLASICTKATDIQMYAATKGLKVQSLYRMNDLGIFGDSGYGTIKGYLSGASGTSGGTATLNVVSTTYGSLALATGTATAKLTGVGLPSMSSTTTTTAATIPLTTSSSSTYTVTFPAGVTSVNLGSVGSPVTLSVGAFLPALPIQSSTMKGYIDTTSGVSTLHVTLLDDGTTHSGFASFTGTLGTSFTARIDDGGSANVNPGNVLTVTSPTGSVPSNAYIGIGTTVCPAAGSSAFTCANVTALGTGVGYNGTYTIGGSAQNITGQVMYGSGALPGPATTLQATSVTGSIFSGMVVYDGGASLTGTPLLITGGGSGVWTVAGNYYPPFSADATMFATFTTLVPGEYIQGAAITNPVKILPNWSACGIAGAYPGLLGCYTLSGSPNAANAVGSSGAGTVVLTGTTITDGGAIAPGPALTILDQGPAVTFPLTNFSAKTGTIALSGTYDVATLSGTPSGIQALVSNSANGQPLTGCTPCNWGALTGTISGGKWSGTLAGVPGGGPYFVSVRAANGIAYATLPSSVRVGQIFALWGQGQAASVPTSQGGNYTSYFSGLWGFGGLTGAFGFNELYLQGPPITANFVPSQTFAYAGDRFGISAFAEGGVAFDQDILNAFGSPATLLNATHDGVGVGPYTLGNAPQVQTVGVGDGLTLSWCSSLTFCASAGVSPSAKLVFDAASLTGGWFNSATITLATVGGVANSPVFTATTRVGGALEPGMALNTPNAPTLVRCLTGCSSQMAFGGSTWLLSNSLDVGATPTRADPVAGLIPFGGTTTPWPNFNIQQSGTSVYNFGGYGTPLVKAGTFQISVNGTVVCQDSQAFAYNQTGGNCTGATIASSFVNYQTGDYQITFTSGNAPASGAAISAIWTAIISPEPSSSALNRPQGLDFFGDATGAQTGAYTSLFSKAPGGVNGQIYSTFGTDEAYYTNPGLAINSGYRFAGLGYTQMLSWFYGVKFPALVPGASPSVPFLVTGIWRDEGPLVFTNTADQQGVIEQDSEDMATNSTFSGTVVGGVLTLTSNAVGPMWEGEILGCVTYNVTTCPMGPLSGAFITGLTGGAWGTSGSTYNLSVSPGNLTNQPLHNAVYYSGSGPALYLGALNDIIVQSQGLTGTIGRNPHPSNGFTGARRAASRWAAMLWEASTANSNQTTDPNLAADPKLSRANDSAAGAPSPAFDYTNTYAAIATPTAVTSNVLTFNGLSAHARPIVVGQAVTCSGCASNLVVTSVDHPPTQDTRAGQGQIGSLNDGFKVTLSGAPGASGVPFTFGCSPIGGSGGSNCINIDIALSVGGTFGTAAAIDTCGANNLNGNAPNYVVPNGKCQGNGIGEITRGFMIGTQQLMAGGDGTSAVAAGSVYDDGVGLGANGGFNQSGAFTCNIVAAKVVQCVKGPAYSGGVLTGVGSWRSGSTYISYGDWDIVSGRLASLLGYVGGQSFPFTPGTGYTNGSYLGIAATCSTIQSGGSAPRFDVFVSGGSIVDVVPSAAATGNPATGLGVGSTCTVPLTTVTCSGGSCGGAIATIPLAPVEGQGGIGTYNTDSNTMGMFLYDNSGEPGNPLKSFFTNGTGGYFEPGLPLRPFGLFQGAAVSG